MKKQVWNYYCPKCACGVITITHTRLRYGTTRLRVDKCNGCGHEVGLKQVESYTPIENPAFSSAPVPAQQTPELTCTCGVCGAREAAAPHACPYKSGINNDSDTLCTCCDSCRHQCSRAI